MQRLPAARWPHYLARITARYRGELVTLRQLPPGEREPDVVLWRTPLQQLDVDASPDGTTVTILAGAQPAPILISLGILDQVSIQTEGPHLTTLRLFTRDGTVWTLVPLER